eukprot:323286_1
MGEAYFFIEEGFIYFEYYFPQLMFTAIAVSNQTTKWGNNGCLDCYESNSNNVEHCLSECVGANNEFIITGQSDPTSRPLDAWKIWEIVFTDTHNRSDEWQFKIGKTQSKGGLIAESSFRELIDATDISQDMLLPYVHGWWRRQWTQTDGDEWIAARNGKDPFCITTVASPPGHPDVTQNLPGYGPFMSGLQSRIHKPSTEIHCVNLTKRCTRHSDPPTKEPTNEPTPSPTKYPTPEHTAHPIEPAVL